MSYLYKYFNIDISTEIGKKKLESIFFKNELWFSDPRKFNDPFDCNILPEFPKPIKKTEKNKSKHKMIDRRTKRAEDYKDGITTGLNKALDSISICCFSDKNDNPLLWSHYSNGHNGYCLEFDVLKGIDFFRNLYKVVYSNEYPDINFFYESIFKKVFLTKSKIWEYESEWRVIRNEVSGAGKFPMECLTGIILGSKLSTENKEFIINLAGKRKVVPKIYQSTQKERTFNLIINEYKNN